MSAMRVTGFQNLRSRGARALRKFACGASAKWETVHAGQKKQRAATVSGTVARDEGKKRHRWEIAIAPIALGVVTPNGESNA
eukprot:74429-Pleurochrysis_carterae.AAC.1